MSEFNIKINHMHPNELDIRDLKDFLDAASKIMRPEKKDRTETVSLDILDNCITLKLETSSDRLTRNLQDRLTSLEKTRNLSIHPKSFRNGMIQLKKLAKRIKEPIILGTSFAEPDEFFSLDADTFLADNETHWFKTELYVYGKVRNAGGSKPNIHIETDYYGVLIVDTPLNILETLKENILYHEYGVRVEAEQNTDGEIKDKRAKFIEFLDYSPENSTLLEDLQNGKHQKDWDDITNAVDWIRNLRDAV